jgi:Ser/Thr protein kinase RdoA (MazF antagonist)
LIKSATAACLTASERSWLETIDTSIVAYLNDHFPDPTSLSQGILHGDLSFEHVRLLSDRDVYFFDFGDMSWGPVAHELALFLRSFQDSPISFERWADLRSWLLAGYRATRVFTAEDEAAIDVFLLNRVVAEAKYILELNGDQASATGAAVIKSGYRLAEVVLRRGHLAIDPTRQSRPRADQTQVGLRPAAFATNSRSTRL